VILSKIFLGDKRGNSESVSRDEQTVDGTAARIRKMQSLRMDKRWYDIPCNEHKD